MKPYVKTYFEYFDYALDDFVPCEICGSKAVEIHHIDNRGMGGDPLKLKDVIENLMAIDRKCHEEFGDVPEEIERLQKIHLNFMKHNKP